MAKQLGTLEQMLMFAVVRLGNEAHGLRIRREIEEVTGKTISPGALYTTMDRLEQQGLISSWISDETPSSGGRRRKYYQVEPEGAEMLLTGFEGLNRLAEGTLVTLSRLQVGGGGGPPTLCGNEPPGR